MKNTVLLIALILSSFSLTACHSASTELSGDYNCWKAGENKNENRPEHLSFQKNPLQAEWSMQGLGEILKKTGTYTINRSTLEITWSESSGEAWHQIERFNFQINNKNNNLSLIETFNSKASPGREKEYNTSLECIKQ